jgi:ribulose-phosphate 3-epimerase
MGDKIRTVRKWIDEGDLSVDLQVDGGISADTIAHAYDAGANCFVAGTAVFGAPNPDDYSKAIALLRERAVE